MRAFIWLLTGALGILGLTRSALAETLLQSMEDRPLPHFTNLVLIWSKWFLLLPVPWIIYSGVLSFQRGLTARAVFIFAGTIAFAMMSLICAVALAGTLPFIPIGRLF